MSIKETLVKQAALRANVIEKTAVKLGQPEVASALKIVGAIGAAVLIGQFSRRLMQAFDKMMIDAKEPEYYEKMLKGNPKLMEEDPEEVAKLWSTLYRTSPNLAQDPVAAGAFITQNIQMQVVPQFGGPSIDTYKTLSGVESNITGNRKPDTGNAFGVGPEMLFTGGL